MASIDGAPILFVFLNMVLLFCFSPLAVWRRSSLARWFAWMFAGTLGSMVGSLGFLLLGGSDQANPLSICLPFLATAAGAWLSLKGNAEPSVDPMDEGPSGVVPAQSS